MKTTEDCIRIAAAGGGMDLSGAGKTTEDLIRIASAVRKGGGTIYIPGSKTTEDVIRICSAAPGKVIVRWHD